MMNDVLKIAYKFINDEDLKISSYAETDDSFIFQYTFNNKPIFDNCMVRVDKATGIASNYIITEHFNELEKMNFKDVKEV